MSARRLSLVVLALTVLGCAGLASEPAPTPPDPGAAPPEAAPTEPAPVATDTGAAVAPTPPRWGGRGRKVGRGAGGAPNARETPTAEPEPAAPAPEGKRPVGPKPEGVSQVGEKSWTVTRPLVKAWQDDPYSLGNVRESGEGWELVGVRTRPAWHLGMRNGDVLLEVNGHKLNTMVNLMATYLACKNDTKFDVLFLRKGVRTTHHYEIK